MRIMRLRPVRHRFRVLMRIAYYSLAIPAFACLGLSVLWYGTESTRENRTVYRMIDVEPGVRMNQAVGVAETLILSDRTVGVSSIAIVLLVCALIPAVGLAVTYDKHDKRGGRNGRKRRLEDGVR